MSRYSYDDMPPEGYREKGGMRRSSSLIIAFIGVLITLIAILLYLMFSPQEEASQEEAASPDAVTVDIQDVQLLENELDDAALAAASEPEAQPAAEEGRVIVSAYGPLDPPAVYVVQEGDTLSSIASDFSVSPGTIISCNSITDVKDVVPGLRLVIPEISGSYYIAEEGDTADSVALHRNPGLSGDDILALNGMDRDLVAGDRIFIPSLGADLEAEADKGFISPLADGDEVYSFLDVYGGSSLEGVVLAGPAGSAVVAADSGHVIDLPMDKYGKGVKILHDDGYYTVYEGLERILVRQAEKVSKGQPIGSIGTSQTYFGRPAVFFQIEQEGVKIDHALMVKGL